MRKATLLLLLAVLLVLYPKAQKIKIGLNAGISIPELRSNSSNELSRDYKSRLASVFGAFADFNIAQNFSLKTAVEYAGQGGKRTGMQPVTNVPPPLSSMLPPGTMLYANFKNVSVLNYLEIPILAKWEWGNTWKYYVNIGPYVGFLLSAKQKTSGSSQLYFDKDGTQPVTVQGQPLPPQDFGAATDVKSSLQKTNFGITGGAGIEKKICKTSELVLDIRAADGITTLQKDTQNDGKNHTGGMFITLGYVVSLKK